MAEALSWHLHRLRGHTRRLAFGGPLVAAGRIAEDGLAEHRHAVSADGTARPFAPASFDAINHSDVLCCLADKQDVLQVCRDIIALERRMSFSAILIAPDLSQDDYHRALATGPEFIETPTNYPDMLAASGGSMGTCEDLTQDYAETCGRQLDADKAKHDDLVDVLGADAFDERLAEWQTYFNALNEGIPRRYRFTARLARCQHWSGSWLGGTALYR